MDQQEKANRIR